MMKVVYKYPVDITYPRLVVPTGAQLLSAVEQNGEIVIYALVDIREKHDTYIIPDVTYNILVLGTGHEVARWKLDSYTFLDTVKMNDGVLMFHVFYKEVVWCSL